MENREKLIAELEEVLRDNSWEDIDPEFPYQKYLVKKIKEIEEEIKNRPLYFISSKKVSEKKLEGWIKILKDTKQELLNSPSSY